MVSGGQKAIKYLLFLVNILILILSIVVIAASSVFVYNLTKGITDTIDTPKTSLALLISVALFAFFISFLGCCGAVKESYGLLYAYGWVILLLLIVEFIAAVLVYRFRSEIKDEAVKGLKIGIEKWSGRSYEPLDDIQKQLKCCGAENANDWHLNPKFNVTLEYPNSCCKDLPHPESCPKPEYTEPCVPKIVEEFKSVALQVGGVGIAVAVIQLLAVISSCALARAFKREYEVV